jgi:hypothetical protein
MWWSKSSERPSRHCCDTCHFEKAGWLQLWLGAGPIPIAMGQYERFQGLAPGGGAHLHHQDSCIIPVLRRANIAMDALLCVRVQVWICRRKTKLCKKMPWVAIESPKQKNWVSFQARNQIPLEHTHYSRSHGEGSWSRNGNTKSHSHLYIM